MRALSTPGDGGFSTYHDDADLSPEEAALSAQLRARAQQMGCECRPAVTINHRARTIELEHLPSCPALRHEGANPWMN